MARTTLMPHSDRTNIWRTQIGLGIGRERLLHVRQTVSNYLALRSCEGERFWNAILPENRAYESRKTYLDLMSWLFDEHRVLDWQQQRDLEAGIRLHDIGYARSAGADHPEQGYEVLRDPEIQKELGLSSIYDMDTVLNMVKYHGLFSDVGFLYRPDMISSFNFPTRISLAVMGALDSTAKPLKEGGFHSMLFSRLLRRYQKLLENPSITFEEKLQQLFGPMNYVWLEDTHAEALTAGIEEEGLKGESGFEALAGRTYFRCWPLLKDLITPQIEFASSFYTPVDPSHIPHLVSFLMVMARLLGKAAPQNDVMVDTAFNYFDFSLRPSYLASLRKDLSDPASELGQIDDCTFGFGNQKISFLGDQILLDHSR
ncbi:MAG: hypothetical protein WC490_07190 [Candidatus Margulisiibacteriota bacterium]